MKKTLIAAALLAGFAGAASAQSSVTLYGVVDMGIEFQNVKSGNNFRFTDGITTKSSMSKFGMVSGVQNGSRWGLKGVEDLGGGLKANFVYESSVNANDGTGANNFTRQSTVGLSSSTWGAIDLGRRTAPSTYAFSGIDPFGSAFGTAALTKSFGTNFIRYSNMVMYTTPNFSGFTAAVGYSFDTALGNGRVLQSTTNNPVNPVVPYAYETNNKTRAISIGLRYANGPLLVAGTWDRINAAGSAYVGVPPNAAGLNSDKIDVWALGATYDFKIAKIHAAYGQQIGGVVNNQALIGGTALVPELTSNPAGSTVSGGGLLFAAGARTNSWMVGLTAPIGDNVKVFGSVQQLIPGGTFNTWTVSRMSDQTIASIGATYDLSKRTNLYAYYSYVNNVAMLNGVKANTVAVGIRHRF
ncbi:porin [Orrella sp. 11846]|uniref:porin n=1 Tax=Orrella sp. 11846 TaxID=3409913 RepID=UPI003B5905CA